MNNNDKLDIIKRTVADTKFVIDEPYYIQSIKTTILYWLLSLCFSSVLLFLFTNISKYTNFWGSNIFFSIYNTLYILLNIIQLYFYFSFFKNKNISLKEKHFLKLFSIIPIFISVGKIIYPLSSYLNFEFLLSLYDSIPLDLIVTLIGTVLLWNYFKENKYLYLSFLTILYILVSSVLKVVTFALEEINYLLINVFNIIDFINLYSIFIILIFILATYFISKGNCHE